MKSQPLSMMRLLFYSLGLFTISALAEFPEPHDSEQGNPQPISATEALGKIKLPAGFRAELFAAEPLVRNPIAMTFDMRGRLWVAENFTYAERSVRLEKGLRDRVLIFDDTDEDGRPDATRVFTDQLHTLTSIAHDEDGLWALCPPQLLFIPDANRDDVPDGAPRVILDGFTVPMENHHNFANGLQWGPDGWLYGRCGASSPGEIGRPGTPAAARVPVRGGIWRFHPQRGVFEALMHGTTNPWGHDWDARGELFFINTVNGHLWHGITGAHFVRPHTMDPHPFAYGLIEQHADHFHFDTGKGWMASRDGASNDLGGGHAHSGLLIYQGGAWPAEWHGKLMTLNFHGRRINVERLERSGSGFVGKHEPDFALFGDPWFRGIDLATGPDGNVWVLDWSDTGECHENTGVHRNSGRIYKLIHGVAAPTPKDRSPAALAALHTHTNEFHARAARKTLQALARHGEDIGAALTALRVLLQPEHPAVHRLRALWTLHALGTIEEATLLSLLKDRDESIRTWAIRLLSDAWPLDTVLGKRPSQPEGMPSPATLAALRQLAATDESGLVRLALASTLQRLPHSQRAVIASALMQRADDAQDHNLPTLVWYGIAALGDSEAGTLAKLGGECEWPGLLRFIARRLATLVERQPAALDALLQGVQQRPVPFREAVLAGLRDGFNGWRKAPKPAAWDAFAALLPQPPQDLAALFGDGRALDEVQRIALDEKAEMAQRKVALQTLVDARAPQLRALCEKLIGLRFLNAVALRGLALENDPALGSKIAAAYRSFAVEDRAQVIATLVTRPAWAGALLAQVEAGKIPRDAISAFDARQIRNLGDAALNERLAKTWGDLRETDASKRERITALKSHLTPAVLREADPREGRAVYATLCATCHKLYGEGGHIGPDLTGSGRDNLDYLLENIIDPGAVVTADYRLTLLTLRDGRVLAGVITAQAERTLTLQTMTEAHTIERSEISKREESPVSMMPEGLLQTLSEKQIRDLFAYLMGREQSLLPAAR